jgi:hypothetical protein
MRTNIYWPRESHDNKSKITWEEILHPKEGEVVKAGITEEVEGEEDPETTRTIGQLQEVEKTLNTSSSRMDTGERRQHSHMRWSRITSFNLYRVLIEREWT